MRFKPAKAIKAQRFMSKKLKLTPLSQHPKLIAGCDLTFLDTRKIPTTAIGCFVLLEFRTMKIKDVKYGTMQISIPYIPGLLAFREVPLLVKIYNQLPKKPDVILVDGQGIAHPRKFGLASHLGLLIKKPTIGCAKKPLYGKFTEPPSKKGNYTYIKSDTGEKIGVVLRTKENTKPIFVSPGNLIDVESSRNVVLETCTHYRIPEPTRLAHNFLKSYRIKLHDYML